MCMECQRINNNLTCAAFPDGIPYEIILSEFDHREPFDGDHGLRFVQDEELKGTSGNPLLEGEKASKVRGIRP